MAQLINISAVGVPDLSDMNGNPTVRFGAVRDADLDANKIIRLSAMHTVEKLNSAGSSVQEQATMHQTETMTLFDTYNCAKFNFQATKMITLTV